MIVNGAGLSIAEAAARTGLTAHTLRYYERDGLMLSAVGRSASGHRRYAADDIAWIELVTRLRATGMPIREIQRYAELVRAGDGTEYDRLALLQAHRSRVLAQLAEVTDHLGAIDFKIGVYSDRLETLRLTSSALEVVDCSHDN
ncbi:MerR family transcriptional regulator [Rhodococcus sp. NPDC055112]